jgi:phage gpG-like protein
MSGVGAHLRVGDDVIGRHLQRLLALDAGKYAATTHDFGEHLIGDIQDNLDGQKLFDGSAMPQSRAALKRSGKTLIDKHHLYDSYVYQSVAGGIAWGSSKAYARIHHEGGMTGRGHKTKILPRPVMGFGDKQERKLGDLLIAEIGRLQ